MTDFATRIAELEAKIKARRGQHGEIKRLERELRDTRTKQLKAEYWAKLDFEAQAVWEKLTRFGVRA